MSFKTRYNKVRSAGEAYLNKVGTQTTTVRVLAGISLVLIALTVVALAVGFVLAFYWVMWKLWLFVIPQLFVTAPETIKYPGYWLFTAAGILLNWIRNIIFGSRTSKESK